MELKVGDTVEFKKYEDMTEDEIACIGRKYFPKSGKITEIRNDGFFTVEYYGYIFNPKSVARVIGDVDDVDVNRLKVGDEVLMKATIRKISGNHVSISWVNNNKGDVVKVLKHKEPEHFIVQEDYYGMYIGFARELVSDKSKAKLHASLDAANEAATDMQLDDWDVIPYDN